MARPQGQSCFRFGPAIRFYGQEFSIESNDWLSSPFVRHGTAGSCWKFRIRCELKQCPSQSTLFPINSIATCRPWSNLISEVCFRSKYPCPRIWHTLSRLYIWYTTRLRYPRCHHNAAGMFSIIIRARYFALAETS